MLSSAFVLFFIMHSKKKSYVLSELTRASVICVRWWGKKGQEPCVVFCLMAIELRLVVVVVVVADASCVACQEMYNIQTGRERGVLLYIRG